MRVSKLRGSSIACVCLAIVLGAAESVCAQRTLVIKNATIETVGKQGRLENATMLVRDGKILEIGDDVDVPLAAQVVDAKGKTVIPGIVDPYYTVSISRNVQAAATRTVVFGGRVFVIGGGPPAIATTFAKVSDAFVPAETDFGPALRSGITSLHIVTGGYAQSSIAVAKGDAKSDAEITVEQPDAQLLATVTNSTDSLDILRKNLKSPASGKDEAKSSDASSGDSASAGRARSVGFRGAASAPSSVTSSTRSQGDPETAELWAKVSSGAASVFVNVNNASSILHVNKVFSGQPKAKFAMIASGQDVYLAMDDMDPKQCSLILPPRLDVVPNSGYRINVPKILDEKKFEFAISLSLGQSEFRDRQDTPLFGLAVLVRSGLDPQSALKSVTMTPAKMMGVDKSVGSLEAGKRANFIILSGEPFATTTGIEQVYIDGKPNDEL